MVSQKAIDVLIQLHQFTIEGKIDWERTDNEDSYRVAVPGASIEIQKNYSKENRNEHFSSMIVLRFYNNDGDLIDELDEVDFLDVQINNSRGMLVEIYNMARHIAMGVDDTMDEILVFLGGIESDKLDEEPEQKGRFRRN